MILVTGATGNIGRALLKELRGTQVRGLTRDAARAGFPEAVEGDLTRPETLNSALEGARSLFLLQGTGAEEDILVHARRAGVEHVVLVSSITVETHPHLPAAKRNRAVEEAVRDSGMEWTILRPTQFASNTLWWAPAIRERGEVRAPYVDTGLPAIHPADIAAVAHRALTTPAHRNRTYALTGPARVTVGEQVAALADALGRTITLTELTRTEAHDDMTAYLDPETANAILDLTGGDVNEALLRVRSTVPEIIGAPGRTYGQWARENADAFR
ncbi:SDR family oxidoreductase [Streptomyces acidiscabies]|uniref:Capsule biosynthesis protein CapD n=1 Tax=Streptomyces acidiscabies TaxID=42234 RepID=A0A0L0K540_9ACTN|nr:NAD(P)H-binding protein [Streptomyces acidiscabies]KND32804.1 capsule biosynthesis protein CapD [Streptomyces acidiscabies]